MICVGVNTPFCPLIKSKHKHDKLMAVLLITGFFLCEPVSPTHSANFSLAHYYYFMWKGSDWKKKLGPVNYLFHVHCSLFSVHNVKVVAFFIPFHSIVVSDERCLTHTALCASCVCVPFTLLLFQFELIAWEVNTIT